MSGCKHSGRQRATAEQLVVLMCMGIIFCSCKDRASKAENREPVASLDDAAKAAPDAPLDPSFLPTDALAPLHGMNLDSEPPCSLTIDTLRPALKSVAEHQEKLAAATSEATAIRLLNDLSSDLRARLPAIQPRTESDELRRISAELSASLGDLAESLQLASDALGNHDTSAAATTLRRIHNGVANTRSSVEGLIEQCAL